jgi:copper chaperone NosL
MTVTDTRFGAEIVTKKGQGCISLMIHIACSSYLKGKNLEHSSIMDIYFTDFCNDHLLTKSGNALLLKSDQLKSPMSGNIAAFSNADSLKSVMNEIGGSVITWNELNKP